MFDKFFDYLNNELIIEITPDSFRFTNFKKTWELPTRVFVNNKNEVVGVGTNSSREIVREISLFVNTHEQSEDLGPYFLKYLTDGAMKRTSNSFMRPIVRIRNVKSLRPYFNGYEETVLSTFCAKAGAREIYFID